MNTTTQQFNKYTLAILISIISYQLVLIGEAQEVSFLGIKLGTEAFIEKWFLIIPSVLLLFQSAAGYLRVYQQECIEWLLYRYRNDEYKGGIYRAAFPASHILAVDLMRRINSEDKPKSATLLAFVFAYFSVWLPSLYILGAYVYTYQKYQNDWQLITSFIISLLCLILKSKTVIQSQEL